MATYNKMANNLAQNDIAYVEMRFEAKHTAARLVECGTQAYEIASLRTRVIAAAIDLCILTVAALVFNGLMSTAGLLFSVILLFVFQWYFLSERFGQTPGKMVMNIFVVRGDGEFPTARDAVVRTVGYVVNVMTLGLGWAWMIGDKHEQGWHDKLAKTFVVKS